MNSIHIDNVYTLFLNKYNYLYIYIYSLHLILCIHNTLKLYTKVYTYMYTPSKTVFSFIYKLCKI